MKKLLIKSIAAVTLWAACVAAVFFIAGCSPDKPAQPSTDTVPVVNDTAQNTGNPGQDSNTGQDSSPDDSDRSWETWTECSQKPGDHPCNFTLVDQHGKTVELYDYYGKVVVVDLSSIWCAVCKNIAQMGDIMVSDYGADNFVWLTVLIDGPSYGTPPTADEIQAWVEEYQITGPVLAADRTLIDLNAETGYPVTSWPTLVVINRDMVLYNGVNGWSESVIRSWVEAAL